MRRNSLHDTESVYTSNRTLIIRVFCDSRPSDESLYRQNGETLSGELNFVILPGMETLQLEPTTPPPSARMTQLSRGLTSFYRVVTTLARCRVSSEAVNWRYAKLTHYLRPALASGSLTVCVVMGCDRRSLAAGRRLGRLAQRATVRRRVNLEAVAAGLRERGRELGEELCVARGMLERVARELEEVRGEREELVKRNEEREREVAGLRGELERMRGRDGLRENMKEDMKEKEDMNDMNGLRENRDEEMEDKVNRKEDKEDMKEDMKDMKEMVNRKEEMEEEMVNRDEEMEDMKGRLEEKKKEVDGLKRMMEEKKKEMDGLRGVVEEKKKEMERMREGWVKEREEKNRELDTMREEREELERQLAAMRRPAVRDPTDKSDHEDPINTPIPVSSNNASDLAAMNNPINPTSIVNTPSTTNMTNPINPINTPNTINPINPINTPNTTNPTNPTNETNPINSSNTPNPTSPCSQESLETLRERLREQETQTRLAALRSATLE